MRPVEVVVGDSATFRVTMTEADNITPFPLDGYSIVFTLKRSTTDSPAAAIYSGTSATDDGTVVIVSPSTAGLVDIIIPDTITVLLRSGRRYYFSVRVEGASTQKYTATRGVIVALAAAKE